MFLVVAGLLHLFLGVAGFIGPFVEGAGAGGEGELFGILAVNGALNIVNLVGGAVLLAAAMAIDSVTTQAAGVPFDVGDGAGNMLYPSTMFRINGVDPVKAGRAWELIPALMDEAEKTGRRRFPRKKPIVRPQRNPIEWRANLTQIKNPDGSAVSGIDARELSYGEVEGRRQCWDVFEFIKSVTPARCISFW